jgi:uncharacterized protein (TIGR02996 family)
MHDAFLESIIETPDDDTPRLIFSDWLDEQGDHDRAEFIRLQCRLAQQTFPDTDDRLRAEDLLDTHESAWLDGFPESDEIRPSLFERGFVDRANVSSLEAFRDHAAALRQTTVRTIRVERGGYERGSLPADWPGWSECRGLSGLAFSFFGFGPEETALLLTSPYLAELRTLRITYSDFDSHSLAALAASSRVASLTHLDLKNHRVFVEGIRALGRSSTLCNLRTLELDHDPLAGPEGNRFDGAAVIALSQAPTLRNLTRLSLCPVELDAPAVAALATSPYLTGLRSLGFACAKEFTPDLRPLLGSPILAGLEHLDLHDLCLSAAAVKELVGSPRPAHLRALGLRVESCGIEGVEALLASPWAAGLQELELVDAPRWLRDRSPVLALGNADSLGELRELKLIQAHTGDAELKALASNRHLSRLTSLSLGYADNATTAAGLRNFAESPNLSALRRFYFRGGGLGGIVVQGLADTPLASRLVALNLRAQQLGPYDVRPFLDRSRWPRLVRLELAENSLGHAIPADLRACWGSAVNLVDKKRQYYWFE